MVRKRTLKTDPYKFQALEWGNRNHRKVLALHGWLDNANSFLPMAPYLTDYHVVALDLLGHGLSDHLLKGSVYHFIDAVPQIYRVLNALKWDKCVLLGHSMGGGISALAAATYPERVEKLVLIEALGPFSRDPEEGPAFLRKHIESVAALKAKKVPTYAKREDAALARKAASDFSIEISRTLCDRGLKKVGARWTWRTDPRLRLESPMRLSEPQVQAYIRRITCPTLLIRGQNGLQWNLEMMMARRRLISNLEYQEIPGGHHLHMEDPRGVAARITTFLKPLNVAGS